MAFKIVWTEPAIEHLREVCSYIADDSPGAAEKLGADILRHVEILADFPLIGTHYRREELRGVREILCGNYRIFYRVHRRPDLVEVLTIWHAARDEPPLNN